MGPYQDPILPKAHPEVLQQVAYDPFALMPQTLPPHPRVFATAARLAVARGNLVRHEWARSALKLLAENSHPDQSPSPDPRRAFRNALLWRLTDDPAARQSAVDCLRLAADVTPANAQTTPDAWPQASAAAADFAMAYDLLAATGLDDETERGFRDELTAARRNFDLCPHFACGNHNTHNLQRGLAAALALGDRQQLHDVLYGWECRGEWRYGLIHQLRHDVLGDGLHWERTLGYHFYTLMALTNLADMLANAGIDIWQLQLPGTNKNDLRDLHDAYGPRGKKCLKAAFDAPLYAIFGNGDLSFVNDSGLFNIRGVWIWGVIYNLAYEAYRDPKYAWLLNRIEREYGSQRDRPSLPMPLQTHHADVDFVRLSSLDYPEATFAPAGTQEISLAGRLQRDCSLFPMHGTVVLRSDACDPRAPAVALTYGPHRAGHQSPAALHLDLHLAGRPVTEAPRDHGYDQPTYLTWVRATIAHNTVTIDERPMFPYDCEGDSVFEADTWRDGLSDSRLVFFAPDDGFHAARLCNDNVYPGVVLDRTVIVTADGVLDIYRVTADRPRCIDWAMHCVGSIPLPPAAAGVSLGNQRGYRHLTGARQLDGSGGPLHLRWDCGNEPQAVVLLPPPGATVLVAKDFVPYRKRLLGELSEPGDRSCLLVRKTASQAVFTSLWAAVAEPPPALTMSGDSAADDLTLMATVGGCRRQFLVPAGPSAPQCKAEP